MGSHERRTPEMFLKRQLLGSFFNSFMYTRHLLWKAQFEMKSHLSVDKRQKNHDTEGGKVIGFPVVHTITI
jgi:hypothetical protein